MRAPRYDGSRHLSADVPGMPAKRCIIARTVQERMLAGVPVEHPVYRKRARKARLSAIIGFVRRGPVHGSDGPDNYPFGCAPMPLPDVATRCRYWHRCQGRPQVGIVGDVTRGSAAIPAVIPGAKQAAWLISMSRGIRCQHV